MLYCNMKSDRYFSILKTIAEDVVPVRRFRHTALIVLRNTIIGVGFNQLKTHPLQKQFAKNSESIYLHAEIDALINSLKRCSVDDLRRATLYVIRVDKRGYLGNSTPCEGCARAIVKFQIRNVVHS